MPYLRFFRDERGYEHTYLLHGLGTGTRPRLLYWFRTPPNVNVGRLPLDEDAIRAIENSNADLTFDWTRILRVKPKPEPVTASAAEAVRNEEAGPVAGAGEAREVRVAGAHPVAVLVGDDGLARLRAQYAELRARLTESRAEPRLREKVAARVEALNPDGWRPGEEAVVGIERFEAEAAAIKVDLGRRRRRSSRPRRRQEEEPAEERGENGDPVAE